MRLTVTQTECAGKLFWIVQDTTPAWLYHGPFADEAAARAFARPINSEAWKELLREARENRSFQAALRNARNARAVPEPEIVPTELVHELETEQLS